MPDKQIKKHRVPFEKLVIGPITVVGEMMSGGHWMEMLKIQRQAATYGSYGEAAVRFLIRRKTFKTKAHTQYNREICGDN